MDAPSEPEEGWNGDGNYGLDMFRQESPLDQFLGNLKRRVTLPILAACPSAKRNDVLDGSARYVTLIIVVKQFTGILELDDQQRRTRFNACYRQIYKLS